MNFMSACHTCKERIHHFRGEECLTLIPFYKRHAKCLKDHPEAVETREDQLQEMWWMRSNDYADWESAVVCEKCGTESAPRHTHVFSLCEHCTCLWYMDKDEPRKETYIVEGENMVDAFTNLTKQLQDEQNKYAIGTLDNYTHGPTTYADCLKTPAKQGQFIFALENPPRPMCEARQSPKGLAWFPVRSNPCHTS